MIFDLVTQGRILWFDQETDGTVVVDDQQTIDTSVDNAADKPFLQINDRTVYKTADDAKRGWDEAQKTITSLSGFKQVLKELGAPEGADPQYLKGLLQEYLQLAAEKKAAGTKQKTTSSSEEDKEFEGVDPQVVAQTKRGRQWLKENAAKVGLISKDDYDKLKSEFEEFKGGFTQKQQEEHNAVVEEGQQNVSKWLGDAKVTLSDGERLKLENLIVAYVNSDEAITNKWLRGDRASKLEMIREGYSMFLPIVKPGASPFAKAATNAAAGKQKIGLVNRTKNLPQNDGGGVDKDGKKIPSPRIGDGSLRNRAFEIMKKFEAEQNGEE